MSTCAALLSDIIQTARKVGLDQNALAKAAGVTPETISRAKKRSTIDLVTLDALARASGLQVNLTPLDPPTPGARNSPLADPRWALAWSNPDASAEALVSKALLKGAFTAILEAVLAHGMPFVRDQWGKVCACRDDAPGQRIQDHVNTMLGNIEKGLSRVAA